MELSAEQTTQIEEFAGLFFKPDDIAIVMDLDLKEFNGSRFEMDDFRIPFLRGKLLKEAAFRKKVLELALKGSTAAQILIKDMIKDQTLRDISV